jgi:hypothetical protein
MCGQNVELLSVKRGGTYSDHWALEGCIVLLVMKTCGPERLELTADETTLRHLLFAWCCDVICTRQQLVLRTQH